MMLFMVQKPAQLLPYSLASLQLAFALLALLNFATESAIGGAISSPAGGFGSLSGLQIRARTIGTGILINQWNLFSNGNRIRISICNWIFDWRILNLPTSKLRIFNWKGCQARWYYFHSANEGNPSLGIHHQQIIQQQRFQFPLLLSELQNLQQHV